MPCRVRKGETCFGGVGWNRLGLVTLGQVRLG